MSFKNSYQQQRSTPKRGRLLCPGLFVVERLVRLPRPQLLGLDLRRLERHLLKHQEPRKENFIISLARLP